MCVCVCVCAHSMLTACLPYYPVNVCVVCVHAFVHSIDREPCVSLALQCVYMRVYAYVCVCVSDVCAHSFDQ